ncbi:radical SAM protein [bacterium SCSIO 12741]|nr:radical SAM protein [bacterium SCSIO 12741]
MLREKVRNINARVYPGKVLVGPEWVVLGVNNVCNLHCKMCDVGNGNTDTVFAQNLVGTHPLNMPLELISKIIDQTARYSPKSKLAYAFTEPLVYPHLEESLKLADQKGLFTTITTNALVLRQKAKMLCESGLNELYVSLDGPQDVHNEIRGNKRSFQKALEGLEVLAGEKNPPKIDVICAITEWNTGNLMELLDSLKGMPIREVSFMHTQFTDEKMAEIHNAKWGHLYPATASNLDEVDFSKMDLNELMNEIREMRKRDYPFRISFSPEIEDPDYLQDYYLKPERILGKYCTAIFSSIMFKSDGSAIPAHGRCFNLTLGNLYEQDFPQIWNSKTAADFRTSIMKEGGFMPACSRCCSAT